MKFLLLPIAVLVGVTAVPSTTRKGAFGYYLNAKVPRPLVLHCDVNPGRRFIVTLDAQAKLVRFHGGPTMEISGLKRQGDTFHIHGRSTSYYFMLTLDQTPSVVFGEDDSALQSAPCRRAAAEPSA